MNRTHKMICLSAFVAAFAYVLARAAMMDITYDEAWTLRHFVRLDAMNILNCTPCNANNHIANTLLIKLLFGYGEGSVFLARLPNVAAFLLYLYFAFRTAGRFLSGFVSVAAFLLLIINPFLLDFFSIARGYGLSLAFEMTSLYFLLSFFSLKIKKYALWSLLFGGLAVICNFTLLNYWLVLLVVINLLTFAGNRSGTGKMLLVSACAMLPVIAVIYEPVRKLRENGSLFYGGENDFYSDTLVSLTRSSMYFTESHVYLILNIFLVVLLAAIVLSYRRGFALTAPKNILLYVTVLCISSVIAQHYLLGTLYVIDRTALFFYPLFMLLLCLALNDIRGLTAPIAAGVFVAAFTVNFALHATLYKTALWYFDSRTQAVLGYLNETGRRMNKVIKLDFSWPFRSSAGYYVSTGKYPFIKVIEGYPMHPDAAYYVYLSSRIEKVGYDPTDPKEQPILAMPKTELVGYPAEGIYVYRLYSR